MIDCKAIRIIGLSGDKVLQLIDIGAVQIASLYTTVRIPVELISLIVYRQSIRADQPASENNLLLSIQIGAQDRNR